MFRGIARILGHRLTGWACAAAAGGLVVALAVSGAQTRREAAFLRGRIAALATHDAGQLQAELASCQATSRSYAAALAASAPRAAPALKTTRVKLASGDAVAAELVSNPPAGVDVCARMESADQAVLKALDRR
jgi:hypothetical protein